MLRIKEQVVRLEMRSDPSGSTALSQEDTKASKEGYMRLNQKIDYLIKQLSANER